MLGQCTSYALLIDTKTSTYRACKQICQNKNLEVEIDWEHPGINPGHLVTWAGNQPPGYVAWRSLKLHYSIYIVLQYITIGHMLSFSNFIQIWACKGAVRGVVKMYS